MDQEESNQIWQVHRHAYKRVYMYVHGHGHVAAWTNQDESNKDLAGMCVDMPIDVHMVVCLGTCIGVCMVMCTGIYI